MSFDAISGVATLDASGYVDETDEVVNSQEELATSSETAADSLFEIDAAGAAAGAAMAGLGFGMQGAFDSTRDMRAELGRVAQNMDMTQDEATDLATSMSDATFPVEEVSATMRELQRQGVETEDEMERLALQADAIADATGSSADVIAGDLAPTLRGIDGDLESFAENADTITHAVNNSTLEAQDFGRVLEQNTDDLREMNVSSDEAIMLLTALEEETGMSGRALRSEFNQAVSEAENENTDLAQAMGLTEEQVSDTAAEFENAEGATEEMAEQEAEAATLTDELRSRWSDLQLQLADTLGPIDAIAPALQGAGSAALLVSTINTSRLIPSLAGAAGAVTAKAAALTGTLVPALTATTVAGAPVWALLLGLGAAAAALYAAWRTNFLGIKDTTEWVFGVIGDAIDWVIRQINRIPGIDIDIDDARDSISDLAGTASDALPEIGQDMDDVDDDIDGDLTDPDNIDEALESDEMAWEGAGEDAGDSFGSGFNDGVVESLDVDEVAEHGIEQIDEEIAELEGEIDELASGATTHAEWQQVDDLESQIADLRAEREDLAAAEDITDIDDQFVADVAEMELEEERREAEAIAGVYDELEARDLDLDVDTDVDASEFAIDHPDLEDGVDVDDLGADDSDRRQDSLTKADVREAMRRALQDVRYTLNLETDRRGLEQFIDDRAEAVVDDMIT